MHRPVFDITANGQSIGQRYAFNSSQRAIVAHMRELANARGGVWRLVETSGTRDETGRFHTGRRVWQSGDDRIEFQITRVRDAA